MRDQPVDGLALGRHGAALGGGDLRAPISPSERASSPVGKAVVAELEGADQRAVHDQVGIAPDRRGEVRVAAQVEPEMAVVLRRVFGLRLGAQHDLVDELLDVAALDASRMRLKPAGRSAPALGSEMSRVARNSRSACELLDGAARHGRDRSAACAALSSVSAAATLARIMNSSISRCASRRSRRDHAVDGAVRLEHDLALRQVEIERVALVAGALERAIGGVERPQHAVEQRRGRVVRAAVDRRLRLRVVELGRRAHQHAMKACARACGRRRRSPCARRAPARSSLRLAASRDRWRCAPAASARRGRGNRPSCRARSASRSSAEPGRT